MNYFSTRINQKVGFVNCCGQFPQDNTGRVIEKCQNEFGHFVRIKIDDSKEVVTVHNFVTSGIGCYIL